MAARRVMLLITPPNSALRLVLRRQSWPATPVSYAGVARRTTRRVVRTDYRINALPPGCHYGPYYGGNYWNCGGVYYEQSGNVYIQVTVQ